MMVQTLPIDSIVASEDCQARASSSQATVAEYAEALAGGATFPPITVFHDGERYFLADGFHRLEAHKVAGLTEVNAEIREGDSRDAKLFAAGANASHGLRRTQADKRNAIIKLLDDPEWRQWSDREIAKYTATDHKTVGKIRRELSGEGVNGEIPIERKFTTRHGTEATRKVQPGGGEKQAGIAERVLAGLPDEVLLAEVQRRGLMEGAQ